MLVKAIKTRSFIPPKDDLFSLIKESFSNLKLKEKSIFVITTKIISIWQGRCIKKEDFLDKDDLIKQEADFYIDRKMIPGEHVMLTIKENLLIPTAGIDESNANDYYILWPDKPFSTAKKIFNFIRKEYKLKKFGVILSDSHTTPLRWGTMGIALSFCGFNPLKDYRQKKDIFGKKMKITQANWADALSAAAVCVMGEGKEQTPIAIIEDVGFVDFTGKGFRKNPLAIDPDIDIYAPLLKLIKWKKGKGNITK